MSREISPPIRLEAVRLYFEGFSYDDIAKKLAIGKGSVTAIIQELRSGRFPEFGNIVKEVNQVREISVGLHKLKISITEGGNLFVLLRRLVEIGVEPKQLETWVRLCQSIPEGERFDRSRIIQAAIRLASLEAAEGLKYEEVLARLNSTSAQMKELGEKVDASKAQLTQLEDNKQTLTKACKELESQRKRLEGESRGLTENIEQLSNQCRKLEMTVQDRQTVLSQLEDKDRDLSERVPRLEERAAALEKQIADKTIVLKELESMSFSQSALDQLKIGLTKMAERYGKEGVVARFFEHIGQFDALLEVEATKEALMGEVNALVKHRDSLKGLSDKWGLSPDEVTEGIAALKDLRRKGVLPSAIAYYERALTGAGTDPQSFQKLVSDFGSIEQALMARRSDLEAREQELQAKRRAIEILKGEETKVKESIATLRQSAVKEIEQIAGSAKSEVNRLCQGMQRDIARWGNMRGEVGKYQEELRLARYFSTVPLSQAALNNLINEIGAPIVLQYLTISRAWCRARFNPKQRPPPAIIKKYYAFRDCTPVELGDVITWALAIFIGGTTE